MYPDILSTMFPVAHRRLGIIISPESSNSRSSRENQWRSHEETDTRNHGVEQAKRRRQKKGENGGQAAESRCLSRAYLARPTSSKRVPGREKSHRGCPNGHRSLDAEHTLGAQRIGPQGSGVADQSNRSKPGKNTPHHELRSALDNARAVLRRRIPPRGDSGAEP